MISLGEMSTLPSALKGNRHQSSYLFAAEAATGRSCASSGTVASVARRHSIGPHCLTTAAGAGARLDEDEEGVFFLSPETLVTGADADVAAAAAGPYSEASHAGKSGSHHGRPGVAAQAASTPAHCASDSEVKVP